MILITCMHSLLECETLFIKIHTINLSYFQSVLLVASFLYLALFLSTVPYLLHSMYSHMFAQCLELCGLCRNVNRSFQKQNICAQNVFPYFQNCINKQTGKWVRRKGHLFFILYLSYLLEMTAKNASSWLYTLYPQTHGGTCSLSQTGEHKQ